MARTFTIFWEPLEAIIPTSGGPQFTIQNVRPCLAFDAATDEIVGFEGILPAECLGSGTFKVRILAMANTTTAADDARLDVTGECITPDNSESGNSDSFSSADSGTITFSTTAYSVESVTITLTNFKSGESPTAGDRLRIRLNRDANNGSSLDDLAVDLLVISVEFWEET